MKSFFGTFLIIAFLSTRLSAAEDSSLLSDFNQRLENIYGQKDKMTKDKQVIIMTIETISLSLLQDLISKPDAAAIKSMSDQITTLQRTRTVEDFTSEIEKIKTDPRNLNEVLVDPNGLHTTVDLKLKPYYANRIESLRERIIKFQNSNEITEKFRQEVLENINSEIKSTLSSPKSYIPSSELTNHTIVSTRLSHQANQTVKILEAQRSVAITNAQRAARINNLIEQIKVSSLQTRKGSLLKLRNVLVRGTQVLIVLDIGARVYVLNSLETKDPGAVPLAAFYCAANECEQELDNYLANISLAKE